MSTVLDLLVSGFLDQALDLVEQHLKSTADPHEQTSLLLSKAHVMQKMGRYGEAQDLASQALEQARSHGWQPLVVDALLRLGYALNYFGDHEASARYLTEVNTLLHSSDWSDQPAEELKSRLAFYHFLQGDLHHRRSNLNTAITEFTTSLALFREAGYLYGLTKSVVYLAMVYQNRGELDKSLSTLQKGFELSVEINCPELQSIALHRMGLTYQILGDFGRAEDFYRRSLDVRRRLGNPHRSAMILGRLVQVHVLQNRCGDAVPFLDELRTITSNHPSNAVINQICSLFEAIYLKASSRIVNKAQAQRQLQELVDTPLIHQEFAVLAMLELAELLIFEVRTTGNPEAMQELGSLADYILEQAKTQRSYTLLAEAYLLHAKLALVTLNYRKATQMVMEAFFLADENGLVTLREKVEVERAILEEKISKMQERGEQMSLQERLELAELEEMVVLVDHNPEMLLEEPILFMVINPYGTCIYSHNYGAKTVVNEQLLGGFISAVNAISQEAFAVSGSVERVEHQGFTLVTKPRDNLLYCYIFRGPSFYAIQRFNAILNLVREDNVLHEVLRQHAVDGQVLTNPELAGRLELLLTEVDATIKVD